MTVLALQDPPAMARGRGPHDAGRAMRFFSRTDVRLGLIAIVCLIPRAVAAWRLPAVCDDAYYYLHVADSLEQGRFARALEYLNINIYPVVLIGMHRLGFDWIVGAQLWGILTGTALVLPLFDWLRQMFDQRIALLGAFLYAVHPRIVEPTVEPLRESTFWFFFVLCLDLIWRAARERRWWQFTAGGLSLALALHTRMEAWFLLPPLFGWMAVSWWRIPAARLRLVTGTLMCLAVTPLFVLLTNVTLLAHHSQWELGRLSPFLLVGQWAQAPLADAPAAAPAPVDGSSHALDASAHPAADAQSGGPAATLRLYFYEMTRTLGAVFLALTTIGLVWGRRRLRDPNQVVLAVLTFAVLLAIWVRVSQIGNLNGRYFLILVFLDAPFTALGALVVIRQLERLGLARDVAWLRPGQASAMLAACLLVAGWAEALSAHHSHRALQVRLGRWIDGRAGRFHSVVADFQSVRPAYAAGRTMPDVATFDEFFGQRFDRSPPDLAIFNPATFREGLLPVLADRAARLGLEPLDLAAFRGGKPEFAVFVRNRP